MFNNFTLNRLKNAYSSHLCKLTIVIQEMHGWFKELLKLYKNELVEKKVLTLH